MLRHCLLWFSVILPFAWKGHFYRWVFGWKIGKGVRIGLSYLDAANVTIGDEVHIGHFNVCKSVRVLEIGEGTWISNFNTFSGSHQRDKNWVSSIKIGQRCMIMSRHLFDAGGGITLGDEVTIAGREVHLWTHTMVHQDDHFALVAKPLVLGNHCYIGARATLLFCELPDSTMVGAGSVVTKSIAETDQILMLAGNPAVVKRQYPRNENSR
jgi:acetyltransferase-like isoleucine patch superfamily enzyme